MKPVRPAIFVLALLMSCETPFEPDLPNDGSGVVVYSFFRPGAPLRIDIFNTTPILQPDKIARRSDLTLRLTRNDQFVEELSANSQGVYISTAIPSALDRYSVETTAGRVPIAASSHVPAPVQIAGGRIARELKDIDVGKYGYPAEITFADPGDLPNYYAVEVLIENCHTGCSDETLNGKRNELLVEEVKVDVSGNADVEIGGGPEEIDGVKYIYFNDDEFNGKNITLKFFVIPVYVDFSTEQNILVKFVLKSITKEYYDYLRTSGFQVELEDGNSFSEPVQIATNVENGLGTFAGYNYSIYSIAP